ncbi:MAG TPA: PhoH family protein [Fastidiosipila sp.]|nr:PhoH family protein [Fastidiosipila sp.]
MKKTYVLDTNVIIVSPHALLSFEENEVVLSVVVLEELDFLKTERGESGVNARQAIRILEALRQKGSLQDGVMLPDGGTLRVELNCEDGDMPAGFGVEKNDNRLLRICMHIQKQGHPTILVTNDIVLRIKAQMLGIKAEGFTTDQVPQTDDQYRGRREVFVPESAIQHFFKEGIDPTVIYQDEAEGPFQDPVLNEFFLIRNDCNLKHTVLGRFNGKRIVPLETLNATPFGVQPRNVGQRFLQEALMAGVDQAPLVIVKGMAGTAKTFYALAVGLEKTMEQDGIFRRVMVVRPNTQFDDDIGFLPGSEQEKIAPLMRPIIDNLEILVDRNEHERYKDERELRGKIEELFDRGIITCEAMNFMRGRSITKTYLVIDEAQNLTPKQAKGILTRVAKGTKLILLGDPMQIDNPLLDERTNGLAYASEHMKGSPLCWQVTMNPDECERSSLAADAILRL